MKILTSQQIREIDTGTIASEGIPSLELMKRAATAFYHCFINAYPEKKTFVGVLAGTGNNGGDALVVARLLHKSGYRVKVFVVELSSRYTEDCAHNVRRIKAEKIAYEVIASDAAFPDLTAFDVLIDGLLGTGLSREVSGIAARMITLINESGKPVMSVDVPSGLFLDRRTEVAVKATDTVTFQIPKLALFLPDNAPFVGEVHIVSIGLSEALIAQADSSFYWTVKKEMSGLLRPLLRFAHKGTQGHALIVGGSEGKCGSVLLAAKAALKTGCGLVTAYLPRCGLTPLQAYFPEAMAIADRHEAYITAIEYALQPDAVGLGVGLGTQVETEEAVHRFLLRCDCPLVLDADALNILSRHKEWLPLLREGTILTPHPKELQRLIGTWRNDYEKIDKMRIFARQYGVIVVLKGAYSMITDGREVYVNSSGTPALATAGSGDVLTGVIASLLAQGYQPLVAARLGVYLHGLTADITSETIHPHSFVASDIIDNIGNAYHFLEKNR